MMNLMKKTLAILFCVLLVLPSSLPVGAENVNERNGWLDADAGTYHGDYDFSLAVVGDTQNLVWREAAGQASYLGATSRLYSWITDRVESKRIQYVIGLGDIVDNDFDSEWEVAKEAITKMDGAVPYSLIRGQGHDTVTKFNRYFAEHTPFTENIGGTFKEGSVANTWQTFSFGGVDYLIFGFDFGAPDDVLAWADKVVAAHPNHRIIVTTHAYLGKDGTTLDRGELSNATGYDDDVKYNEDPERYVPDGRDSDAEFNDGRSIWTKFASKHKNVFMILCGHVITEDIVINQREGDHGNPVTEVLVNAQGMDDGPYNGGVGMVSMFYFDLANHRVAIEYYSTVQKAYRKLNVVDLDHKHVFEDTLVPSTCKDAGYRESICACGKVDKRFELPLKREHTYDSDDDAVCNVCGKIREIQTEEESIEQLPDAESTQEVPTEDIVLEESVSDTEDTAEDVSENETEEPSVHEESTSGNSEGGMEDDTGDGTEDRFRLGVILGISVGAVALLGIGVTVYLLRLKKK